MEQDNRGANTAAESHKVRGHKHRARACPFSLLFSSLFACMIVNRVQVCPLTSQPLHHETGKACEETRQPRRRRSVREMDKLVPANNLA
ncbi:hypothetical protein LZ32DRAFT_406347 [Colletotrichum eremochloae]|nr:hypothetical protein LZ32DRAFT_406347 [Colletotrichum eremochloae]